MALKILNIAVSFIDDVLLMLYFFNDRVTCWHY
jgi:hypothetical protein